MNMSKRDLGEEYLFSFNDDPPKYKHIYEQFKTFIEQGDLHTNEQLLQSVILPISFKSVEIQHFTEKSIRGVD